MRERIKLIIHVLTLRPRAGALHPAYPALLLSASVIVGYSGTVPDAVALFFIPIAQGLCETPKHMFAACFLAHMVLSTIVFMAQVPVLQTTVFALAAGGGAALFWALTFAFFQPYGMIGYVAALLLISFPPIGMLMFLNPLDVAGVLFPSWEIFGIVLTAACCVILYFRPCLFVVIAVLLAHCAVTLVSIEQVKSRTAMLFKDGHVHGKPLNADVKEKQLPYERMFQVYPHFFAALGGTKRVVVTDVPVRTKNARRYDLYLLKKHVNSRLYSAAYVEK